MKNSKTNTAPVVDKAKLTTFLGLTSNLRSPESVLQITGNWAVMASPYKWGDFVDERTAGEHIADVKALGFKSAWIRGGRLGVSLKDLAKAA